MFKDFLQNLNPLNAFRDFTSSAPKVNGGLLTTPIQNALGIPQAQPTQPFTPVVHTTKTVINQPTAQSSQPATPSAAPMTSLPAPQPPTANTGQNPSTVNPNPMLPSPATFGTSPLDETGHVPSNLLASNSTYADIINKRNQLEKQYTDALIRSGDVQVQGLQNVQNARYAGDTQPFAAAMGERATNDANIANLAASNRANAFGKILDVNQQDVTNALGAAPTNIGSNVNQATGDVYVTRKNPTTGQVETTIAGNIGQQKQYTSTSVNQDPMTGNLIFTGVRQDGTIENQILGGGQQGQATGAGFSSGANGQVPFQLSGAVFTAPNGQQYVSKEKLTPGLELAQTTAAKNAGIPVLGPGEVEAVRNIDYVKQNIQGMESVITKILQPGVFGRMENMFTNNIKNILQSDTDVTTFSGYRDTAIKIIQSLAGGPGSGLRLTGGEIATATSNIPTINDNLETAQKKISLLNTFLDTKLGTILPSAAKTSGAGRGTVVQTKAGAINTDW